MVCYILVILINSKDSLHFKDDLNKKFILRISCYKKIKKKNKNLSTSQSRHRKRKFAS